MRLHFWKDQKRSKKCFADRHRALVSHANRTNPVCTFCKGWPSTRASSHSACFYCSDSLSFLPGLRNDSLHFVVALQYDLPKGLTIPALKKFPQSVIDMMSAGGSTVTCLPVQLDDSDSGHGGDVPAAANHQLIDQWQSCIFFRLGGSESRNDIEILQSGAGPFTVGIETDIIEHEHASVVVLRLQVFTNQSDPLVGEVLMTPGGAETHYEILGLLGEQQTLTWFFADQNYRQIYQQSQALSQEWRDEFLALRSEAFKRDSIIRLAGKYNAQAAFADVVSQYALR